MVEKIVPCPQECEQRCRYQCWGRKWYDNAEEYSDFTTTINDCCFFNLFRQTTHKLYEQKYEESIRRKEFRHEYREVSSHPAESVENDILWHERDMSREHKRRQHYHEPEAFAYEFETRECVGCHCAGNQISDNRHRTHQERIYKESPEGRTSVTSPAREVIFDSHGFWYDAWVTENHIIGFERANDHPNDRINHKQTQTDYENMCETVT